MLESHEEMVNKMIQVITSFNQLYYDLIGRDSVDSFLEHWPKDLSLTCYVEGFQMPANARITQIDFSQLDPDYAQYQLDPGLNQSMKKFAKKAYSFMHAMHHSPAEWILWLDADVITVQPLPIELLQRVMQSGDLAMYMGVTYYTDKSGAIAGNWLVPETGVFAVNTQHEDFAAFRAEYCRRYHERDQNDLRRYYDNDVFGAALLAVPDASIFDLCANFKKSYKTPLRHTILGDHLIHYKAKHSKAEYVQGDVDGICVPDND
jgi:hypothetical protein